MTATLFWNELKIIIRTYWKQLLVISLLMWFLLYILNLFLGISLYAGNFSDTMRDKLGMYFYIKDTHWDEHIVYKDIMDLKDKLEDNWLEVMFSSKEDAFDFLQDRIPDVVDSFQKYGIENPLPATLYVMFDNENEYQILRSAIMDYKNIILNIKDIDQGTTLKQQENRVLSIINLTNFVKIASYVLIIVLWTVLLFFLSFLLENIFQRFRKDLSVKKLLWATSWQIAKSFMWITFQVLIVAIIVAIILISVSAIIFNHYLVSLFDVNMFSFLAENIVGFVTIVLFEFVVLFAIHFFVSFSFVKSLNKKI